MTTKTSIPRGIKPCDVIMHKSIFAISTWCKQVGNLSTLTKNYFPSSKLPYRFFEVVSFWIFLLIRFGLQLGLRLGLGVRVRVGCGLVT